MKKLEKKIILDEIDSYSKIIESKTKKLEDIILLFMENEPDIISQKLKRKEKSNQNSTVDNNIENKPNNLNEDKIEDIEKIIESLPKDISIIFKKIVNITHPDKIKDNNLIELYTNYYKKTITAKDKLDKAELIYIAYKLGIEEIYDIDDEHFGSLKKRIKEMELLSSSIENNNFWIWYHTDNIHLKKVMINQIKI
jgi:hypothetical protein